MDPVLAEALAGRHLTDAERRELAATIRRVTSGLPPGRGPMAGLSKRMDATADLLDARAAHRRLAART